MKKKKRNRLLIPFPILIGIGIFLFTACGNIDKEINQVSYSEDDPAEISEGVTMMFSDKGILKLKLEAPIMHRFNDNEESYMKCPSGMVVTFFDTAGIEESKLFANYGIMYSEKEYIMVKESVVFENYKGERLNTELLHVDFKKDSVYTQEKVTITSLKGTITGTGLQSNSSFTKYKVKNISNGVLNYQKDEVNLDNE